MTRPPQDEAEYLARRRKRNIAIGLVLCALAVLFYGITLSRLGA